MDYNYPYSSTGHGDLCFAPPDLNFYAGVCGRGWKEKFYRSRPPTLRVTVGVNSYSHFFLVSIKTTQTNPTVDPSGNPDAHTCHSTSHLHPPPGPWPRGCAPPTPTCSYTSIHSMPITPEKLQPKTCGRSTLLAATGPRNMHDGGGWDYGCGLGIDTDANDAVGGWWVRPEAPAGRSEGGREGRRGSQIMTHYNEAEWRRVRGPRAAAHLRRRPDRRPVGYGGGGARPPTQ